MEQVMASGLLDPLQAKAYEGTRHLYSTSDDEAHDFTVPEDKPFVPTPSIRESLAATILGGEASQLYGLREGGSPTLRATTTQSRPSQEGLTVRRLGSVGS